jgi:ABC-type glycerol-3-phosphate transport system substrate-binding protein
MGHAHAACRRGAPRARRRFLAIALSGAVLAAIGAADVLGPMAPASAQRGVALKFMRPGRFDVVERVFRPIVASFEKENPGIKVEFVDMGWDEYFRRLPIMLSSSTAPDVMLNQQGGIYQYGAENQFLALDRFIDEELRKQLAPGLLEATTVNGRIVGIPASVGAYVLWYRPDLFEKAGLDPARAPQTWVELLQYAEAIKAKAGVPGLGMHAKPGVDLADTYAYFYHSAVGRPLWDSKLNQIDLRTPGAAEALRFMKKLVDSPGVQPHVDQYDRPALRSLLRDGRIGMMFDGPWILNVIREQLQGASPLIRAAQVPAGPAGRHSITVVDAWAIPEHTRHPAEAWKLLRYLVRSANQAAHDTGYGSIPPQEAEARMAEFQAPHFQELVVALGHGFSSRVNTPRYGEVNDRLPENVQRVLIGRATPEQALSDLARQMGWK